MTKFIDWFNQLSEEGKKYYLGCLPETLLDGKDYTKLYKLLSDYEFITTKINHPLFGIQALIEDYDLLDNSKIRYNSEYAETVKALKLIQGTLSRSAHIIFQDSKQLKGQLSARLTHFDLPEIKNLLAQIATDKNIGLYSLMGSLIPPGGGLIRTLEGHSYSVEAIAVTPDGKTVISGSVDKTIKIWDLVTGTEKFTVKGHSYSVKVIAVTPDGKTVISASRDKTIKIWDLVTGTEKFTVKGHSYSVKVIVFTPDGKTVISASTDNTIKIWDVETGTEKFTLKGHSSWVSAIALTPDGKILISGSHDNTIKIWEIETGAEIATFTGESPINCCAVAADGVTIVAGEESGKLHFLRLQGRGEG